MFGFKRGRRVRVVASADKPATVGRVGEVCDVSPLHGDRAAPGRIAVDGVRAPELDLILGPPTYTPDQLRLVDDEDDEFRSFAWEMGDLDDD